MDFVGLKNVIQSRRSIRKWLPKAVPDELLLKAIEVAMWAPNGGNYQPWRYHVVQNKAIIEKMGEAVENLSRQMLTWPEAADNIETLKTWLSTASFFKNAPSCVAVTVLQYESLTDKLVKARSDFDQVAKDVLISRTISNARAQTAAATVSYLLLALHQLGLGAVWMVGPTQSKSQIESILNIPSDQDFVALVPVGYPDDTPKNPGRKQVSELVNIIR